MASRQHSKTQALRVAKLYYYEKLTTNQIAAALGVSRPIVSRLLKEAHETGLVETVVHDLSFHLNDIEERLRSSFALRDVQVVPVAERARGDTWAQQVGTYASNYLKSIMRPGFTVGVALGKTISAIAEQLTPKRVESIRFVQLHGSSVSTSMASYPGSETVQRFSEAFDAPLTVFPVPAYFDFPETKQTMWKERSIRRILNARTAADVFLFSVGTVTDGEPSMPADEDFLRSDVESLRVHHAIGHIGTVFFREDGSYTDIPINARATGPPLSEYRSGRISLCVSSGRDRQRALIAALRAGFVTTLIVDEPTAREIAAMPEP